MTDSEAKILVAECLGELGAVDPGRSAWHSSTSCFARLISSSMENWPFARSGHMVQNREQVAQWDFQNKATRTSPSGLTFVLEVPLRNLLTLLLYHVTGSCKGPIIYM